MDFQKRKASAIAALASTETDKSPKGTLDAAIVPLIDAINCQPSYFTTSSCSGRISIFSHPKITDGKVPRKKARGGTWIFVSHEPADADVILKLLYPSSKSTQSSDSPSELSELVFRFEPLIIAVECKDLEAAQSLVSLAIRCGFRESGITSVSKRVIVGIRCSIRLEVPLGDKNKVLVPPEYTRFLVGVANEKMEANRRRTDEFLHAFKAGVVAEMIFPNTIDPDAMDEASVGNNSKEHGCNYGDNGDDKLEKAEGNGLVGVPGCNLFITPIVIVSEPTEKLFRWGHSACTFSNTNRKEVLVFGGFGGIGRHARRNDCLLLDTLSGALKAIYIEGAPSPRLGHTSSLIRDSMFTIGGRADPLNILSDLWVLNMATNKWELRECSGVSFPPRHRHAAAVVGSNIYVHGGLNNDTIYSSLYVLNTENMKWKELSVGGEQPCARHSHSMVAYGSKLFIFGGHNGDKLLGDLYSFDVQTCLWKKEKVAGRCPHARFSHSMFVYKNYVGIIGGCPIRQHLQELALLDIQRKIWKHVTLESTGKELFVRSTASVVGDDLVMVGGGAACYAFGTKFSDTLKIDLLPLTAFEDITTAEIRAKHDNHKYEKITPEKHSSVEGSDVGSGECSTLSSGLNWVLRLERNYAKLGKDILKKFGWLDHGRKVYSKEDGKHICFPVTEKFCAVFLEEKHHMASSKPFIREGDLLNDVSASVALNLLKKCGASKVVDEVVEARRTAKSPFQMMREAVASLIKPFHLSEGLLAQLPTRWERLGDIVVLPVSSFTDPAWDSIGDELWPSIARSLNTSRLARQGRVAPTGTRDSTLEMLVGDDGWVDHRENGILYSFDATKCMFSWGNLSEKHRMASIDCKDEVIVDLFAGIGYFVLPLLVRAKAKLVYACEWNPHAIEALRRNIQANAVSDRCIILEGDNCMTAPKGVADRVCLGLLPTSEGSWGTAVRALRREGGMLHVHGNVKDSEEDMWTELVQKSCHEIARAEGQCWEVSIEHVERVKWYAPHIRHLVADVRCRDVED
ncbi:Met-10+ like family protein / kelch repeat-containing protein putative isoform 1 [Tripterygium wilfordii]|uniref:tRNA wybutosine-synthesizing protein 3 n=1 Tax=Tripterygium wilfordii TaxID=458696 RepID=A0A7J7C4K7_TRIWF|nr:tRNA wybutosine-synthesizing protein 2/3/4 [Tripterygium wilfordii]KAF5729052.1 Met-10+ like family protein / kelch repeat-containing protein putative isoform 1 [Tripterygium wilfordii]